MGKNIHQQIISGHAVVKHGKEVKQLPFPTWLADMGGCLQDSEGMLENLKKEGLLLPFLHAGLTAVVIEWRAHVRPEEDKPLSGVTDAHSMNYRPTTKDIPKTKTGTITTDTALQHLVDAGITPEQFAIMMKTLQK